MIALALAIATALAPAQEAFDRGDYREAESLALQAGESGDALYLAGLARFREGQFGGALELLQRAGQAPNPPPPATWHFNQGACLYELGRYPEAQKEYLLAAEEDESLRVIALVDAGFAALDGGDAKKARELSASARSRALDAKSLELVADLDAHLGPIASADYSEGILAYDAGNYAAARDRFLLAVHADAADGKSLIMAAASAYRLGAQKAAREELTQALRLPLEPGDREIAQQYLDLIDRNGGFSGSARIGAGYDSNPLQTGLFEPSEFPSASTNPGSALATADLAFAWRFTPRDGMLAEFDYGFQQVAYFDGSAADRSIEEHILGFSLQTTVLEHLRLGFSLTGEYDFTGLGDFRSLQGLGRFGLFASYDETVRTSTRIDLAVSRKVGESEFDYLTGNRVDGAATQEFLSGAWTLDFGYAFRLEDIGQSSQSTECPPGAPEQIVDSCVSVEAFGYVGHSFWSSVKIATLEKLSLSVSAGVEFRSYLDDDYVLIGGQRTNVHSRIDQLYFAGATASWKVSSALAISLRYDMFVNQSNLNGGQRGLPDRQYNKQVLSLGTLMWW